jgi:glycosyltransferase involved in cell wall biosynthesis
MRKPFFSIVIPTYSRAKDLKFAIYCVLRQTYEDFEIVISDNASHDNTDEIVKSFSDKRIRYYRNEKNIGTMPNVQKVISLARGSYIFLHSDDDFLLNSNILSKVHNNLVKGSYRCYRINYLTRSTDKKNIFDFSDNKKYSKDTILEKNAADKDVIKFILDIDSPFISGLIIKNSFPSNAHILNADYIPWFQFLFYAIKKWGGYYHAEYGMISSWSEWRFIPDVEVYPLYGVQNGKLRVEQFFEEVKKRLEKESYTTFLHDQLLFIYVRRLIAVKYCTGNRNVVNMVRRILELSPEFRTSLFFWINASIAFIAPSFLLSFVRKLFLYKLARTEKQFLTISKEVHDLEKNFENLSQLNQ